MEKFCQKFSGLGLLEFLSGPWICYWVVLYLRTTSNSLVQKTFEQLLNNDINVVCVCAVKTFEQRLNNDINVVCVCAVTLRIRGASF